MSDLLEMRHFSRQNAGFNYVLVCVDCLSKFAWCVPLKTKNGPAVRDALVSTFKSSGRVPRKFQTNQGKEYYNKLAPVESVQGGGLLGGEFSEGQYGRASDSNSQGKNLASLFPYWEKEMGGRPG